MSEVATTNQDNNELALTEQDIVFVAAKTQGLTAIDALLQAYPEDEELKGWNEMRNSQEQKDREYGKLMLRRKANVMSRRRAVEVLAEHYQKRIEQMGETALDTLEELMVEAKSEKVRADVAIEVTRHNLGNPDKDQTKGADTVVVIIGEPPKDIRNMATVHMNKQQMGVDIDYNQTVNEAHERKQAQFNAAVEAEIIE